MATEADIRTWIKGYQRDFNQLCQALMWRLAEKFGTIVSTPGSAIAAYRTELAAGRIKGGTPPPGSFVYWDIGADGHVGFMLNGGRIFMGSTKIDEQWSNWNTGPQGLADYSALTGAKYLGWSYRNGGNSVPFTASSTSGGIGSGGAVNYHWYRLTVDAMKAIQQMLDALDLYSGPDDGDFGYNSVVALMEYLKRRGFLKPDYVVDGIPHNEDQEAPSLYGFALQDWAKADGGYTLDRDGLPASGTSAALIIAANKVKASVTPVTPPPPPVVDPAPALPLAPNGWVFMPDLGSSQAAFDFGEFYEKGGRWCALKMGGGNASDSPYIAPAYVAQMARARAQSIRLVHYWFNGRENGLTPELSAEFFVEHDGLMLGEVLAIDIEDETATNTKAYTPAEAVLFAKRVAQLLPGFKGGLAYMSDSLADREEWDELRALGWQLWSASWGANTGDPGEPPSTDDWPFHLVWQYTSVERVPGNYTTTNGVKTYQNTDGNLARADLFDLLGYVPAAPDPDPEPDPDSEPSDAERTLATLRDVLREVLA